MAPVNNAGGLADPGPKPIKPVKPPRLTHARGLVTSTIMSDNDIDQSKKNLTSNISAGLRVMRNEQDYASATPAQKLQKQEDVRVAKTDSFNRESLVVNGVGAGSQVAFPGPGGQQAFQAAAQRVAAQLASDQLARAQYPAAIAQYNTAVAQHKAAVAAFQAAKKAAKARPAAQQTEEESGEENEEESEEESEVAEEEDENDDDDDENDEDGAAGADAAPEQGSNDMPDSEGSADEDDDEPAEEDAADGPSDPDEEEDEQEVPASVIANWPMSKVTTSAGPGSRAWLIRDLILPDGLDDGDIKKSKNNLGCSIFKAIKKMKNDPNHAYQQATEAEKTQMEEDIRIPKTDKFNERSIVYGGKPVGRARAIEGLAAEQALGQSSSGQQASIQRLRLNVVEDDGEKYEG